MKKHIQIKDGYRAWLPRKMKESINRKYALQYVDFSLFKIKNINALVIEWLLHNIGYWLTRPFLFVPFLKKINLRCKDVDLMVEVPNDKN